MNDRREICCTNGNFDELNLAIRDGWIVVAGNPVNTSTKDGGINFILKREPKNENDLEESVHKAQKPVYKGWM